ncbi:MULTISPECIES: sulfurtransferase [Thiorhodovibrio]|uniref:sulfurtransferase n=1 Tax=Thiorhodovibrio TaxID=61593 RepID=UPI001F5C300D|nr:MULTISPECIES: sulfurtransferase [Thiorhodovibrio]
MNRLFHHSIRGGLALALSVLLLWALPAAAETLRVTPEWLNDHLQQPDMVLVDARAPADYAAGHLPGAVNLPELATYRDRGRDGRIVEPPVMQELLRELGVRPDATLVVYDDGSLLSSARVFWTLEVYGLKHVRLLDKGFAGWQARDFPVATDTPKPARSDYVAEVDPRRIATRFTTQLAMTDPQQQLIDARSPDAYLGKVSKAKRFGHIPSAINIPVHGNLAQAPDGSALRNLDELAQIYAEVPKERNLVLYCDIGRVSAVNYLALRELGYQVANYDASWLEWGNDSGLPIVGP